MTHKESVQLQDDLITSESAQPFYGWINAALLFTLFMLSMGIIYYGFSTIFPAMIKDMGWNRGTAAMAHSIATLFIGLFTPITAILIRRIGTKKTIMLGISLSITGLMLLGTVMTQMWQWMIIWGVIMGASFSLAGFMPVVNIVVNWFSAKRATATGIVITGAAVGGVFAQPFFTWLMSTFGSWRLGWLAGTGFAAAGLLCSCFIVSRPQDIGQYPDGVPPDDTNEPKRVSTSAIYRTIEVWQLKEVFQTRAVYIYMVVLLTQLMPLFLIVSHGILHFTDQGVSQMQAASILSFTILGSGMARFPAGFIGDRVEPRKVLTVTFILEIIAFLILWQSHIVPVLIAAGILFGFCYGCQLTMNPTILSNYYGPEVYASITGISSPFVIPFTAVVPAGAGYIFETYGSYDIAFIVILISVIVALTGTLLLAPPVKSIRESPMKRNE